MVGNDDFHKLLGAAISSLLFNLKSLSTKRMPLLFEGLSEATKVAEMERPTSRSGRVPEKSKGILFVGVAGIGPATSPM